MNKIILFFASILFFAGVAKGQANINWQWQNTTNSKQNDIEYKNGFLYSVGNTSNGIFISKMDTLGNTIWTNNYTGLANLENLTVDNLGAVYAIGAFSSSITIGSNTLVSSGAKDILLIKCNTNGTLILAKKAGGTSIDAGVDIAVDYANNIYVIANTGQFTFANTTNASNGYISILKYNSVGNEVWFNWMNGGTNAISLTQSTSYGVTSLKYSQIDSSLVFSGFFNEGGLNYSINSYWNFVKNYNQWGGLDAFIVKIETNGNWNDRWHNGSYDNNLIISDIAIHDNGNIYFSMTNGFSLNGYLSNTWETISYGSNSTDIVYTSLSSSGNWGSMNPCGGVYGGGHTQKLFYNNNTLYGLLYQPELDCGNLNCSDYYALKINTTNNTQTYVSLDPTKDFYGIAGNNGSYFLGSNNSIGKSCENGCSTNFSLNPALNKTYCSNPILIGNPECFYVKGGTPAYTYSWSPSTGLNATNIAQPTVSGITTNMVYTLTVSDQIGNVIYDTVNVSIGLPTIGAITNIAICQSQLPFLWNGQYYNYGGNSTQTYLNSTGCDSIVTLNLTVNNNPNSFTNDSICESMLPYSWNGQTFTNAGNYQANFPITNSCDSIAYLNLYVKNEQNSNPWYWYMPPLHDTICSNLLPYIWNGQNLTATGMYTNSYNSQWTNCIVTDTIFLFVKPSVGISTNISLCTSQLPYLWNGQSITSGGIYTVTFTNLNGCDTVETLNLIVNQPSVSTINASVCSNQLPYIWNGQNITSAGAHTFQTTNAVGCDSIATLNLTIKQTSSSSTNVIVCSNQLPYSWNGQNYTSGGVHTYQTTNAAGCDSIATLNLTINQTSSSTTNASVCSNQLPYSWNGQSITSGGIHTFQIMNAAGCDSIATLILTINQASLSTTNASVCSNQLPYSWNGQNYTSAGAHTFQTTNSIGCDSISTLNLTINNIPLSNIIPYTDSTICVGTPIVLYADTNYSNYSWTLNGNIVSATDSVIINSSGSYLLSCTDSNNCSLTDSVSFTLNPTPQPIILQNNYILYTSNLANAYYQWSLNGTILSNNDSITITQNGSYILIVTSSTGCIGIDTFVVSALTLNEFSNNHSINIYPNPTDNTFTINYDLEKTSNVSIRLLDMTGKVISNITSNENQSKGSHKKVVNLKSLSISEGMYMLQLSDGVSKWNQRVIYRN